MKYATALDWFLLMSFFYCIATLLEFAGVHFFTKVGSGEIPATLNDYEDDDEPLDGADGAQAVAAAGDAAEWEDIADDAATTDDDEADNDGPAVGNGNGNGDGDGDVVRMEPSLAMAALKRGGGQSRDALIDSVYGVSVRNR